MAFPESGPKPRPKTPEVAPAAADAPSIELGPQFEAGEAQLHDHMIELSEHLARAASDPSAMPNRLEAAAALSGALGRLGPQYQILTNAPVTPALHMIGLAIQEIMGGAQNQNAQETDGMREAA